MKRSNSAFARHRAYLLASGAVLVAAGMLASAVNAEDFVIDQPVDQTNDRNPINDDDKLTITPTGSITTDEDLEHGVSAGNGNTIINAGRISTAGQSAIGIEGDFGNVITNSGEIGTTGSASEGMVVGDNNTITNSGSITTLGELAEGIVVGSGNVITNSGEISTTGIASEGMDVEDDNTITNSGRISTAGDLAEGIEGSFQNVINNSGSISTAGRQAFGIIVDDSSEVSNSGSIITAGENAGGIQGSANSTMTNSGSIITTGDFAEGIAALDGNRITNSGSISTTGSLAHGILATDTNEITNTGSISTRSASGIVANDSNRITNSGSISATGKESTGIATRNDNRIANTGSIVTKNGAVGIDALNNNEITNSGLVLAEGIAFAFGAGNTLNLLAPSFIGGKIFLGTGATLNITTGASHSVLWDLQPTGPLVGGAPNVTGPVASFFNAGTKQFATLDPTSFAATFDSLGDMTGQLSNVGRQGLSGRFGNAYGAAYGLKDGGGDPAIAYGKSLWVTPFGSKTEHKGDDLTLDRDITQAGVALGYRWQQEADLGLGVMAGYLRDESDTSSRFAKSHDSEADAFFAGINGRKQWGSLFVDFALVGGFMSHDQDRFVNDNLAPLGVSFANASYNSRFISPEVGLSVSFDAGNGFSLTPGAKLRYAAQWLDGYTEQGGRANATVEGRMLGLLEASAEIAATQRLNFGSITGRLGVLSRSSTGDDDVSVSLVDVSNTVAFGTGEDMAGYVGLNASFNAGDNLKLDLDGQATFGEDFTGVQGMARIIQRF